MNFHRLRSWVPLIIVLVFAFCFPLITSEPYIFCLIIPGLIWAVACMGWTLVMRVGQLSLGQAGFMAIGAYASAMLTINLHVPVWLGLLFGGVISAIVAMLMGMVVLRLGGLYFAIVTLAFGEIVRVITMNLTSVTNGIYGLIPPLPSLVIGSYAVDFAQSKVPYYYLALLLMIGAALVFWRVDNSRLGRIFRSISSDSRLSEHIGMPLMKYRVIAFTTAGFFTGIAGALYSSYLRFIGPTLLGLWQSITILIMSAVGGAGSAVAGPIIGAMLLSPLGDYLTSWAPGARALIFGSIVVIVTFLLPDGLVSLKRYFSRGGTRLSKTYNIDDKSPIAR